ncbi:uncharacterized protein LOC142549902 [Primulina tabacum]|uniref:uncharacterized protein LOC142549902 n=1 Tax=Primulina tabacum TaxID=48773 RepID=UPI003F59529A
MFRFYVSLPVRFEGIRSLYSDKLFPSVYSANRLINALLWEQILISRTSYEADRSSTGPIRQTYQYTIHFSSPAKSRPLSALSLTYLLSAKLPIALRTITHSCEMALTNFLLTVAGVSAVILLMRSDVKQSASIFRRNVRHIRNWLEEESTAAAKLWFSG